MPEGLRNKRLGQEYAMGLTIVFTARDAEKEKGIKKGEVVKLQFIPVVNFAVQIDEINPDKGTVVCRKHLGKLKPFDKEYGDPMTLTLAKDSLVVELIPNNNSTLKASGSHEETLPEGLRNKN